MPSMKPGLVMRSAIVSGAWQSMHATGWVNDLRASAYGIWLKCSKPLIKSPPPAFL